MNGRSQTAIAESSDDSAKTYDSGTPAFTVISERSAILIRARSNVGPIEFGTAGVRGAVNATTADGRVVADHTTSARLEVDVASLGSGNSLYDAELRHRIDTRRFPEAVVELQTANALGNDGRFELAGQLTLHGVTAPVRGVVSASMPNDNKLVVSGDQIVDIREFDIAAPTILMLRIYPDVRVYLHVEAESVPE